MRAEQGNEWSRRKLLAAAAGGFAASLAQPVVASRRRTAPAASKYVDIHVHITQAWTEKPPALSTAQLLCWMDQRDIAQAVVLPLVSPESWYYAVSNDLVLAECGRHPQRLIPFCDIDPRNNYLTPKTVLPMLKRYVEAGAKGLGEHKCGVAIDDPRNLVIFRACSDLKLPILFHMDAIRNTDLPGLPGLEKALKAAPNAMFIGHANSWWASISAVSDRKEFAGYPKTPVKPGGAIDRLMDAYPNIYGDLSAGSGLNALKRDPDFARKFVIRRADRLLFGTDYLADGQVVEQFEFLDGLDLPADVERKIYRDNARRLMGLA